MKQYKIISNISPISFEALLNQGLQGWNTPQHTGKTLCQGALGLVNGHSDQFSNDQKRALVQLLSWSTKPRAKKENTMLCLR